MRSLYFTIDQVEELTPLIREIVIGELSKLSQLYDKAVKREQEASFVSQKIAYIKLGVSRQTLIGWQNGKVSAIDISPFVKRKGRFVLYDVEGIARHRKLIKEQAELFGSSRFSNSRT